jgi:hypothetical protein
VADVDRAIPGEPVLQPIGGSGGQLLDEFRPGGQRRHALPPARQRFGVRHVGHLVLVLGSGLRALERSLEVKNRPAVLDRGHPPGREAATIAGAVHVIENGDRRIAEPQEVRVEGVGNAFIDRPTRGHQGLGQDLTAEDALPALRAVAPEDVHLELLEVEQRDQIVE